MWVCHRSGLHAGWGDRGTKAAPDERIGAAPTGCFDIELGVAVESRAGWIADLTALVVSFREVVHSARTEETGVTTLQHPTEGPTSTRMPVSHRCVERRWRCR